MLRSCCEVIKMALLDDVKGALRISGTAFDTEITGLINSAKSDLGIAGVIVPSALDDICTTAIIAYCKFMFGNIDPGDADRWKRIYDENKAQLVTATGYTNWGDV